MEKRVSSAVWGDIVDHVRVHYAELSRGWFSHLHLVDLREGMLIVSAENQAQLRYLNSHCRRPFAEAAQAATGRLVAVRFETDDPPEEEIPLSFEQAEKPLQLCPEYVFDNFITGPCNRLAHAAAVAVAQRPGTAYNPLFVHGDVGLGKTHLLQAILHSVCGLQADLKAMYISCETFANHFLEAVERGAMDLFRYRYRHVDLLIIDDIQFLGDRERSQEEFFHTFNTLHQSQRQIVLSADSPPSEIPSLQNRLVSRFNSGLVASVDRPCLETRMAIIRAKAKLQCIEIPEDVVKLVATRIESNVRELQGALARIDLLSQTTGGRITSDLALEALGVERPAPTISIPEILNLVAKRYNVRLSDLQSKKRARSIAFPRQVCMYLAREMTPLSLEEIGGYFGGRDHTTVIHAHRMIGTRRDHDPQFERSLREFIDALREGARE